MAARKIFTLATAGLLSVAVGVGTASAGAASHELPAPTRTTPVVVNHTQAVPPLPVVTGVRTGRHPAYDRMVIDLRGSMPSYSVGYVGRVTEDPSDRPVPLRGSAFLRIVLHSAEGHDSAFRSTIPHLVPGLPTLREIRPAGDFEGYVSLGVGLSDRNGFRVFELRNPTRLVIDVAHDLPAPTSTALKSFPVGDTRNAHLVALRVGRHPAYDRVVFQTTGPEQGYVVSYQGGVLRVDLRRITMHDANGRLTYTGPRTIHAGFPELRNVRIVRESADGMTVLLDVSHRAGFRVLRLADPTRIAVDIAH